MFVDIAIRRDLISFRKDWARWSAGEKLAAKFTMILTVTTALIILGQAS